MFGTEFFDVNQNSIYVYNAFKLNILSIYALK